MPEIIQCLANREIGIIESTSGVHGQYLAIQSVDRVNLGEIVFLGVSGTETKKKIRKCARCVGSPKRLCDLSQNNLNNLNPQI